MGITHVWHCQETSVGSKFFRELRKSHSFVYFPVKLFSFFFLLSFCDRVDYCGLIFRTYDSV